MDTNCKNLSAVIKRLKELSEDYFDFNPTDVMEIDGPPSFVEFMRYWLSPNIPVIFKKAVSHWPALSKWTHSYLRSKLQNIEISVAITPDGYADAVRNDKFLMPEEKTMTFTEFSQVLLNPKPSVYYIQKQNNNLIDEFKPLHCDVELDIPWATKAIGKKPDAVNFWMGDKRAITSLHKDNYENIYCVVKGKKEFILHPPIDTPWIPYESYESGIYTNVDTDCSVTYLNQKTLWSPIDPLNPDFEKYPLYRNAHPIHCVLSEGDVLYLPSLWYHHVQQSHGCIAVNYWYDMDFNVKYSHFRFLENMRNLIYHPKCHSE